MFVDRLSVLCNYNACDLLEITCIDGGRDGVQFARMGSAAKDKEDRKVAQHGYTPRWFGRGRTLRSLRR